MNFVRTPLARNRNKKNPARVRRFLLEADSCSVPLTLFLPFGQILTCQTPYQIYP